jgi:dihydrofolate synthase/folylpolyglutamate synthase
MDICLIEVGMGGRLDATNVIVPEVCIINNIGMEHTQYLGDSIVSIAAEKAGIMKPKVPCITINTGEALEIIESRASELECPLTIVNPDDIDILGCYPDHTMIRYGCSTYRLGLPGSYQGRNAALAIEAVLALKDSARIRQFIPIGLDDAFWPYRMQKMDGMPLVIDVTHTKKGAEYLRADIERIYGKVTLVTAMLSDKDLDGVAQTLSGIASKVLVSAPDSPRAATAESLAACYRKYHDDVTVFATVGEAVESAMKEEGTILVTGSFRTAEDCLKWVRKTR